MQRMVLHNVSMSAISEGMISRYKGELFLGLSTLFPGVAFVFTRYATFFKLGPDPFNAGRFLVSTLCMAVIKFFSTEYAQIEHEVEVDVVFGNPIKARRPSSASVAPILPHSSNANNCFPYCNGPTLLWGTVLGILNFGASTLQQQGLSTVTANKAGFIVGMYVVFVPVFRGYKHKVHQELGWLQG